VVRDAHAAPGDALVANARSERHPAVRPAAPAEERRRSNFVAESWAELKKVEWPGQNQVIQGTVVVLVACFVVGTYLYINDSIWKHVVTKLLLGQ
jgi:preprotein translocase subunit SecE